MFVDEAVLFARAGDGGAGVAGFKRQRGKPRGKPIGGSGGSGGDVIVRADESVASLIEVKRRPHRKAGSGSHGEGDVKQGRRGDDFVVSVPLGTLVYEGDTLLADLVKPGHSVVVARGGRGGRGNAALAGLRWRAPGFAEQGEYGEEATVRLEVKLIADAALIGFPNAGKSTLISVVSAARPKIADYPFTTLQPQLGVVEVDGTDFVLADIPGLVEGAAEGKGLGHEFLRHTERARVLVVLLDPSATQETGAIEQHDILVGELERFSETLARRPRIVAVSKTDLPEVQDQLPALQDWAAAALGGGESGEPGEEAPSIFPVSSATRDGVEDLMRAVLAAVSTTRREAPEREGYILHRPAGPGFQLTRDGETWVLSGRAAERAVNINDYTTPDAIDFVATRLRRSGIAEAMEQAGVQPGDDVRIGDITFEFRPDTADA